MRVIRCLGWYLLIVTFSYFLQTIICLRNIKLDDFTSMFTSELYAKEIFDYSLLIEQMKVFHSLLLLLISIFLIKTTARYNLLTQSHY